MRGGATESDRRSRDTKGARSGVRMRNRKLGFPAVFFRVFRPELTLPVGVSSGARMRNRKLAYPPFFRVFFHFYFFFFFFLFFLFFIPFFLFLFIYLLFSFFFSFFFLNTRKRNVSITSHK